MIQSDVRQAGLFEHRFWLQILGDHSRFIAQYLPRTAKKELELAIRFMEIFDRLLEQSRKDLPPAELAALHREAQRQSHHLRQFKLYLIRLHLTGHIHTQPTFLNHMVNEADEYLRILSYLIADQLPPLLPSLHHHLLWLSDSAVHASGIRGTLDVTEKQLIEKSGIFVQHFEGMYLEAIELAGFMRSNLDRFPALSRFNREAEMEILLFQGFLKELEELALGAELLASLTPLITDHMSREACYYLTKLAQNSDGKMPDCDPAAPRPET